MSKNNLKIFSGLFSYIGGKRLLASKIMAEAEGKVFIDAMAGACSLSLLAKHLGYRVKSNDLSKRSYYSQLALIENSKDKISEADIARLFESVENAGFIEKAYCPKYFTKSVAKFLDNAFAVIEGIGNKHKQALLKHLLIAYILRMRSFSRFGLTQDTKMLEGGKSVELLESSSESRTKKTLMNMQHPFGILCNIARDINYAVVNTGKECTVSNQDVFEFLKNVQGDSVYLDPPYPGSCSYEETYQVLDSILAGKEMRMPVSVFNKNDSEKFFCKMLEYCEHIPLVLISCGKNPQADTSKDSYEGTELLEIVKRYRKNAKLLIFQHKWSINTLAKKKQAENVEYLIIAKK
jgi:adenine-specific DNA methylase